MLLNTFLILFWWKNQFCVLWATRYENYSLKNRQKTPQNWGVFWRFFSEQFAYLVAESTQKWFFHQNNNRNVFSNIELPLGYNIMTLEYVLERIWKEIAKNMNKKKSNMWKKSEKNVYRISWRDLIEIVRATGQIILSKQNTFRTIQTCVSSY